MAGASALVCAAAFAQGQNTPQLLGLSKKVAPLGGARAIHTENGIERVGDWIAYHGGGGWLSPVFDCYGDGDSDGLPDDLMGCGTGSRRWFFGTGYCSGLSTNDLDLPRGG